MRGLEGGSEGWVIGIGTGVVFTLMISGGCLGRITGGGDSPLDGAKRDCEVAWVVANDGDDKTENETAILDQPWCRQHLAAIEQQEATP